MPLLSKEAVLAFIRESPSRVGKREIARALRLSGSDRATLAALLNELEAEGLVERGAGGGRGRRFAPRDALPKVAVVEVTGTDADGEVMARPVAWRGAGEPPRIYMAADRRGRPALGPGDRVLARLRRIDDTVYEARTIRQIGPAPARVLGVYHPARGGGRVQPTNHRHKRELTIAPGDDGGAQPGELVLTEPLPGHRLSLRQARVVKRLGDASGPRSLSLIAIHDHGIPTEFSEAALAQAAAAQSASAAGRVDLRHLPLVTIDEVDARDFDDAVWAEATDDPKNPGGWHLVVTIADVAWYVRPGDSLDQVAYERGNSVYFPDRVVPMLPEALSNALCALKPDADRPCLAVHLWIDGEGRMLKHRIERAIMRSTARLSYGQVQAARDGRPDAVTEPLLKTGIAPLYGAYVALERARQRRGALDIELPERRVVVRADGRISCIERRLRLDSHRLIEEFMIAANVAAAEILERHRQPLMYRIHDAPDPGKVEALSQVLAGLGYRLAKGRVPKPRQFNQILRKVVSSPEVHLVNELILRSQARAVYSAENIGHFGLALRRYAHFTSPIRRYADLLVHRALITSLDLGAGGLSPDAEAMSTAVAEHISMTERRAVAAERDVCDRYTAQLLTAHIGATFHGRISGVTRFGLFVTLDETGAEGLVPVGTLAADAWRHDARSHRLVGRRSGRADTLGDAVELRRVEAEPITGGLIFHLLNSGTTWNQTARRTGRKKAPDKRRRRRR